MTCYLTCLIATGMLGATISTMLFKRTKESQTLERSLDDSQLEVYRRIVKQRRMHYLQGTLLGVILAFVYPLSIIFFK